MQHVIFAFHIFSVYNINTRTFQQNKILGLEILLLIHAYITHEYCLTITVVFLEIVFDIFFLVTKGVL